jgi:amino acid permease
MISQEEEKFYQQWEKQRVLPHYKRKPFLRGLSFALSLGLLVLVISETGWYERASMVANMRGNEIWIVISILIFSFGYAWIYQQFTFEMNEQRFKELTHIKNKK